MSVENNNLNNSISCNSEERKEWLKKLATEKWLDTKRFDAFLNNLEGETQNTIEFNKDCKRTGLEIIACQQWEEWIENTNNFCRIFDTAFNLQPNNIA